MQRIDNWRPVASPKSRATYGSGAPDVPANGAAQQQRAARLDQTKIFDALEKLDLKPVATHLFLAEGFPWINVVFAKDKVIGPSMVAQVASAMIGAGCDRHSIYFHALGANDVRFLFGIRMVGTENDAELTVEQYGVPLDQLKGAWAEDSTWWTK